MADSRTDDAGPSKLDAPPATGAAAKTVPLDDSFEDVPDPDEDDLDDLDDMLDEFSATRLDPKKPEPETATGPGRPSVPPAAAAEEPSLEDMLSDDEFAKQLQAGMADLLGEIESSPEMQAQFESIFKELGGAAPPGPGPGPGPGPSAAAGGAGPSTAGPNATAAASSNNADDSFQETIRRTMERMQASGQQATAAAAAGSSSSSDDFLAELLKEMQQSGGTDGGEGGEEEFSKMLLGMMEQLTTKEILYEPMKELDDKFPAWLSENRGKTSKEDLTRYEQQQVLVREIVAKFEESSYADAHTADREYIVDRMQKMQVAGSPPPDLVGDMPSAQDALNMSDESCNPQ